MTRFLFVVLIDLALRLIARRVLQRFSILARALGHAGRASGREQHAAHDLALVGPRARAHHQA